MNALCVRGLGKRFGTTDALVDLDLDVPTGSITSILGPSGCGKTTFLRLVAGFLAPDSGSIEVAGTPVAAPGVWVRPQVRRIGYLPQEGALFPHLDVAGNIGFGLTRAERTSQAIEELLDLVELPASYATRAPHELSGGQQQRVALARALAPRPRLVLLDEPFSALDAALRESTGRSVARVLRASGATGILVTHDQAEALSLSDQVVTLREGRLVQACDPATAYLHPVDAGQAQFVGGATLLPGRVIGNTVSCALGELMLAPDVDRGPRGSAVQVVLRPEQVQLTATAGTGAAEVIEVNYYGHDAAVHLRMADATLVSRITDAVPPALGDRVDVRVNGPVLTFPAP